MVRCNIILDNFRHNYIIATAFRFTSGDIWSDVKRCFYVIFTSDSIEASSKRYSILLFITGIFFADVKPLLLSKICTSEQPLEALYVTIWSLNHGLKILVCINMFMFIWNMKLKTLMLYQSLGWLKIVVSNTCDVLDDIVRIFCLRFYWLAQFYLFFNY
jgi:hypothetical protein